ncbi:hypothetical protein [Ferrimonas marina]|uniref:Uncharacterized protein n=1 Tax=Ferrimonas marina TaxID=299255 RepID=A0A1M5TZL1_9GAMM|nr:hypothetical protein [Ferrimonas marina]SHH56265.1 hypothetical protein SAMN02745129_2346 [Ferrimonas marina]
MRYAVETDNDTSLQMEQHDLTALMAKAQWVGSLRRWLLSPVSYVTPILLMPLSAVAGSWIAALGFGLAISSVIGLLFVERQLFWPMQSDLISQQDLLRQRLQQLGSRPGSEEGVEEAIALCQQIKSLHQVASVLKHQPWMGSPALDQEIIRYRSLQEQ